YNKFIVIENGINIEKFKRAKPYKKEKINSDFKETDKLICMVGRFSTQKDQATIIKAIKKIPKNIHLLLIGEGKLKEKNKNLAEKLDVLNRIHFLGFRNDIDKIYKTVDIVVLSSNWEGFGLAALEGMAAGKPVVASNVSGLKKLVQGAGLLFPRGDDKKLAEKIKNLLSNYDKYKRTSDLCFKRSQLFDIKKMVQRYINEYKKLNDD
ncbi:MAG: glycosyltransferase family 4 protein, partial [Campylobacterota bacterium]|nr:glycosyltransferase family 4 protein [Campylobacterota bacterium]